MRFFKDEEQKHPAVRFSGRPCKYLTVREFTLLELLIVIAVIAILTSLLLPALRSAKMQSQTILCNSNLRQIGVAFTTYAMDYNSYCPAAKYPHLSMHYLLGKTDANNNSPEQDRLLAEYLNNNVNLAKCPLDKGDPYPETDLNAFDYYGSSYIYPECEGNDLKEDSSNLPGYYRNAGILPLWSMTSLKSLRISSFSRPGKKVILADLPVLTHPAHRSVSAPEMYWHSSTIPIRVNVLFSDGHTSLEERRQGTGQLLVSPVKYDFY